MSFFCHCFPHFHLGSAALVIFEDHVVLYLLNQYYWNQKHSDLFLEEEDFPVFTIPHFPLFWIFEELQGKGAYDGILNFEASLYSILKTKNQKFYIGTFLVTSRTRITLRIFISLTFLKVISIFKKVQVCHHKQPTAPMMVYF